MPLRARARPLGVALLALALACFALLAGARPAFAWVDAHVEADDVRISLSPGGVARVEHRITLKIAGGPLRSLDVRGVDRDAVPDPDGYVVPLKEANLNSLASAVPITAELMPPGAKPEADGSPSLPVLKIRFQNERGLGRGVYVILVRYGADLSRRITLGGAMPRVEWTGPVWDDGLDSVRVTFDLPAAPSEPRVDDAASLAAPSGNAPAAPLILSTVRRGTARDAIELMRPYTPRGESVSWAIRADPRALRPAGASAKAEPARLADGALAEPARRALILGIGAVVLLAYALLVGFKSAAVARDAAAAGASPRPLVPLSAPLRAALAGLALTAGLGVELLLRRATLGALLVLAATILASHRTSKWERAARLRGPGRWLPVAEADALRIPPRLPGGWLDASTWPGRLGLLLALGVVAGAVALLAEESTYQAELVAFDATALLAIFCTGRRDALPPDPAVAPVRLFRAVARTLRRLMKGEEPRILGRIRTPDGATEPDELRLAVAPRAAIAGFSSIEIGVVHVPGAGGAIGLPEVLLRVTAGSACERAIEPLARHGRVARGRKPEERVYSFSPRLPTARLTAGLVARLTRAVTATPTATPLRAPAAAARRAAA